MLKRAWLTIERCFLFNVIRLFRIRRQSERVARGFALGLIVNFLPTFGFGVVFSGALARIFGGNMIAGFVGGASLSLAWPLLFYINVRVGGLLIPPSVAVEGLEDVTEKTISALVWGKTFLVGAAFNVAFFGMLVYLLLRLVYHQIRPPTLAYFRHHARDHQRRFGRHRFTRLQRPPL